MHDERTSNASNNRLCKFVSFFSSFSSRMNTNLLCFLLCVVVVIIILGVVYTVLTKPNKYPPETTLLFILYIVLYVLKLAMNSMMDTFSLSNVHLRWWNTTFHFPPFNKAKASLSQWLCFLCNEKMSFLKNYFYSIVNSQDNSASLENPL